MLSCLNPFTFQDSYRYRCSECGRLFLQRCDMKRHQLIHSKQEPYKCSECGKGIYTYSITDGQTDRQTEVRHEATPTDTLQTGAVQMYRVTVGKVYINTELSEYHRQTDRGATRSKINVIFTQSRICTNV